MPPNDPTGPQTVRDIPAPKTIAEDEGADPLVRMQAELRRAMAKPVEQRKWMMVIDTRKCIGCRYCVAACPYGARTSDFGRKYTDDTPVLQPYEQQPSHEYGKSWFARRQCPQVPVLPASARTGDVTAV